MASAADEDPSRTRDAADAVDRDDSASGLHFRIGRYELFERIASGGMASVYFGRVVGGGGFRRPVALKRLHPHLATETEFVSMLRDEARLASRIRHRSVVPVLDVVDADGEFLLVMELVDGPSLGAILERLRTDDVPMPLPIASGILRGALAGLGAAHDAKDESGAPLDLVHRDVSPQNVLVGKDGIARVVDFGIAKARGRIHTTDDGRLKGNFAYMAPEQAKRTPVTRRADLYVVGILLWECITGKRLNPDDDAAAILTRVLYEEVPAPSDFRDVSPEVDALLARALARDPDARFATAAEMSDAIGGALGTAGPGEVAEFLRRHMRTELEALEKRIERVEKAPETELGLVPATSTSTPPGAASVPPSESPARVTAVVADVPTPPPPRARRSGLVLPTLALMAIAAAAFVVARRTSDHGTPSPASSMPPVTTTTVTTASVPSATVSAPTSLATTSPPAAVSVSPSTPSASASAASTPVVPTVVKHRPRVPPAPRASASGTATASPSATASARATPTGLEGIPRDRE